MTGGPLFGCGTALVTPFTRTGELDEACARAGSASIRDDIEF